MTRSTETLRQFTATVRIEVEGQRDERHHYRHKWVTSVTCGELTGGGPNTAAAVDALARELQALASCPEAVQALAMVRARESAARDAITAAAKPDPNAPLFADEEAIECAIVTAGGLNWRAASYEGPVGCGRHRVWMVNLGYLEVYTESLRAVNKPAAAAVG